MKKLMTLMLGMGLALGSVAMFAQAPKAADTSTKAPKKKSTATKAPKAKATKAAATKNTKKKAT